MFDNDRVIREAIYLKSAGLTWPQVAERIELLGLRDINGKPIHNANLASMVLASPSGSHLRVREYRKPKPKLKGRPPGSKNRPKATKTSVKGVNVAEYVDTLKKKGVSAEAIVELVSKLF